jgi:hypothetical protein
MTKAPNASSEFEQAEAYLNRLRADEAQALREIITIKDKQGRPVPLNPWPGQLKYLKHKSRVNDIIKIRQQGLTLVNLGVRMAAARLALYFPELRNRQFTIFTKSDEDAATMFNHVRFMDANLPKAFRGTKLKDSAKAIHYEDTGCLIRIMTAGKTEAAATAKGRSATDFGDHITESGYIEYLGSLLAGILGSLAPGGDITLESTSSGPRGFFSQHFLGIMQNGREVDSNVWAWDDRRAMFFGFLEHPEYHLPVPDKFQDEDEEEERILKLGGQPGQIMWRRAKIADYGKAAGGNTLPPEMQFKRDYPVTWQDAFEEAGGAFFNRKILVSVKTYIGETWPKPLEIGLRKADGDRPIHCLPDHSNRFTIFKLPVPGWSGRYAFFSDVGQGRPDGDFDVGYIGDLVDREVVAKFRGRLGAELNTQLSLLLCAYYFNAYLAMDLSGVGAEGRGYLKQSLYPNIWCRYKVDNYLQDPHAIGMVWDRLNRAEAVGRVRQTIERREWHNPDPDFYEEADYFGYHDPDSIKAEAATGFHDDCIMAYAGLMYVADRCGPPGRETPVQPYQDVKQISLQRQLAAIRRAQKDDVGHRLAKGFTGHG